MNREQYKKICAFRSKISEARKAMYQADKNIVRDDASPIDLWEKRARAEGYLMGLINGFSALKEFINAGEE